MRKSFRRAMVCGVMAAGVAGAAAGVSSRAADVAGGAAPGAGRAVLPYQDTSLSFEARAADLVSRMTLQEKAEQLVEMVPRNTRLGIPAMDWGTEALHGLSAGGRGGGGGSGGGSATVFPQAMGMAATWDPALLQNVGDAISTEARARYVEGSRGRGLSLWAPTINMARDPRWGRTAETYGEDPFLAGKLGAGFVRGIQGDDPKYLKAVATPKHFAMHNQEAGKQNTSFDVPDGVLYDYYLPAFRACVVEGKAASIMSSYNGIDGVPNSANKWLLTDVLRTDWGFNGAVVTDRNAVQRLVDGHGYAATYDDAVTDAISAGVDVMSDSGSMASYAVRAVQAKKLDIQVVDRAVTRSLMVRFRLGMFDPPAMVPYAGIKPSAVGSPEHLALALKVAEESFVLLKNDPAPPGFGFGKLLPLDLRRVDSIAVLGPFANALQYGSYGGNAVGHAATPLEAMRAAVGDRVEIRTASWGDLDEEAAVAETSDMVLMVMGLDTQIEKNGVDRTTFDLPADQQRFVERVVRANPRAVAVLEGGSVMGLAYLQQHVPAVMMVWYPGEQGGPAVAKAILGQVNPSGKLPLTFYRAAADLPAMNDYDITKGRTYMYLQKPAVYPFGHGLSYTTFAYRNLVLDRGQIDASGANGRVNLSLEVQNTGGVAGDEVVQVYVRRKDADQENARRVAAKEMMVPERWPIRQLKGFQRVSLAQGQAREITFSLGSGDLAFWDDKKQAYSTLPGEYEIEVGSSSADIRLHGELIVR